MKLLGTYCFFFAGGAGATALWIDHDHFWLWTLANFALCTVGHLILDSRERVAA